MELTLKRRTAWAIAFGILLVILLALLAVPRARAGDLQPPPPPPPPVQEDEPAGDCDFGRHPQKLWFDNPSGHPFERHFCTCPGGDVVCDPLDTLENDGLYCDQVPECWAYGGI